MFRFKIGDKVNVLSHETLCKGIIVLRDYSEDKYTKRTTYTVEFPSQIGLGFEEVIFGEKQLLEMQLLGE